MSGSGLPSLCVTAGTRSSSLPPHYASRIHPRIHHGATSRRGIKLTACVRHRGEAFVQPRLPVSEGLVLCRFPATTANGFPTGSGFNSPVKHLGVCCPRIRCRLASRTLASGNRQSVKTCNAVLNRRTTTQWVCYRLRVRALLSVSCIRFSPLFFLSVLTTPDDVSQLTVCQ